MTCDEVRISLGGYLLGVLDAAEAVEVEAHLDDCPACRAELDELSGLPAMLARVSEQEIQHATTPPRAVLERLVAVSARRDRRSRILLALAASVLVAALGSTAWLSVAQTARESTAVAGRPDTSRSTTAVTPSSPVPTGGSEQTPAPAWSTTEARGSNGDVRLALRLTAQGGGTQIVARVAGVPAGTMCTLSVVDWAGTQTPVGSWTVGPGEYGTGRTVFEGWAAMRVAEIQRFDVTVPDGRMLVSVPVPHPPPSVHG